MVFLYILLEVYCWYGARSLFAQGKYLSLFNIIYISVSVFNLFMLYEIYKNNLIGNVNRTELINFYIGFSFTLFVTKFVFAVSLFIQDGGRYVYGLIAFLKNLVLPDENFATTEMIPSRRLFLTTSASLIAGIPFVSLLYGITKGKYQYSVEKIKLSFNHLPSKFKGFRIVQISDVHAGSFDNVEKVQMGIDMINSLEPDLIVFTGDLVNSEKNEIDPYIETFAKLKAKYGKYAVLGNHDYYGQYNKNNREETEAYWSDFYSKFNQMGFKLLNNASARIKIEDEYINLVGVENWGAGRWFPKKGDLDLATKDIKENEFNILLSHDPTHWDEKVLKHNKRMDITLSGHTHGFQFGINLPGFKWSPAKYRYSKWMGIYQEKDQYLYVNRGFGFLGYPGRVGMLPEITCMELA